jgi:ComF family protein
MNLDIIADILFPPACVGCSRKIRFDALCKPCQQSITLAKTMCCGKCGVPLIEPKKACHADADYLLGTAGRYEDDVLRALVHALKFEWVKAAARPLGQVLIDYVEKVSIDVNDFIVIPIPLSRKRRRSRGFNQSELIARHFAEHFGLLLETKALIRTLHRKPQSETEDIAERKENIRGCFSMDGAANIAGKNIILVDDVTTSGTTLNEAARVLTAAGAKKIIALVTAQA